MVHCQFSNWFNCHICNTSQFIEVFRTIQRADTPAPFKHQIPFLSGNLPLCAFLSPHFFRIFGHKQVVTPPRRGGKGQHGKETPATLTASKREGGYHQLLTSKPAFKPVPVFFRLPSKHTHTITRFCLCIQSISVVGPTLFPDPAVTPGPTPTTHPRRQRRGT